MNKPLILDIKGNSLDDGPGIRSAVFFKGCPLNCIWCHNPESKSLKSEISYDHNKCIGCNRCINACPKHIIHPENEIVIENSCDHCFICTDVCPAKAMVKVGSEIEMEDLLKRLISDKPFYDISGGGVTLSGGEATLHHEWVGNLAKRLKEENISVLLETCGFFNYEIVEKEILPYLKNIYCDLKIYDKDKHIKYCGVSNEIILSNIEKMVKNQEKFGYQILIRTPLIPSISDTKENLEGISSFLESLGVKQTQLLPYNPTWYSKSENLGVKVSEELKNVREFQSKEFLEQCRAIYRSKGIECL